MAHGDIGAVIDSDTFDLTSCDEPNLIHVAGDVFAVTYRCSGDDGRVNTFSVSADGTITNRAIDSFLFDNADCKIPRIIHISGDVFAIVYRGVDDDGWIITFSITAAGDISAAVIDSFEFLPLRPYDITMIHVSGDIYALVYTGYGDDGFVCTVSITAAGDIGAAVIETVEFETSNALEPVVTHVAGDVFAIAYRGPDYDGFVVTISIDSAGDIGAAVIDSFEFDTVICSDPSILQISDNVFAIAYTGDSNAGKLVTFTISAAGAIGAAVIDSFEFDSDNATFIDLIHVSGDVYAISFQGALSDGFLVTVNISSGGNIGAAVIDSLEFEVTDIKYTDLLHVSGDTFLVVFRNASGQGAIKTIGIDEGLPPAVRLELLMGIG